MSRTRKPRLNGQPRERIMVAVRDEGATATGQASLIDNTTKAERIVAALIEAGVESEAVTALRAKELPLEVSYRWSVELLHKGDYQPPEQATPAAAQTAGGQPAVAQPAVPTTNLLSWAGRILEEITPDSPFQLRMDRVLWLGLWAASLFVLAISLMASASRGDSRQFVVGPDSSSSERALQSPGAALELNNQPGVTPTASPQPPPACETTGPADCQCNDFATQPEAQAFFQRYPPASGHDVDPDRDGLVCEWLPQSTPANR
jgi:hypothetical protein